MHIHTIMLCIIVSWLFRLSWSSNLLRSILSDCSIPVTSEYILSRSTQSYDSLHPTRNSEQVLVDEVSLARV